MNFRISLIVVLGAATLLASCSVTGAPNPTTRRVAADITLPSMTTFGPTRAIASNRSNASITQQFMSLAFDLESGRTLPVLSRFEGPITVHTTGLPLHPASDRDLDQLLSRLRTEARIPISRTTNSKANITVEVLKQSELQRFVPQAACFVAPRISSWREFKSRRSSPELNWTTLTTRDRMAVFVPGDVSPQELRDCLHEEIAQALGPVNDLYHLTDSIFNDDNFHTVLTGFDMIVLRAFYDRELASGMSPDAVAARLPGILARINPNGRSGGYAGARSTPRAWISAIEDALGPRGQMSGRISAAKTAVRISREQGWKDNRLGFSLFALGRLALSSDTNLALASFAEAEEIFRSDSNTSLHAAHVSVQAAAYALSAARPADAILIADRSSAIALRAENASLLATLLMIKAEALDGLGRTNEADIVRLDSLGWARYGFGSDAEIRRRLREIAALAPRPERNS